MVRKFLFWLHLVCGVVAGISIGLMCLTGTILAFEKELAAWNERDARQIVAPPAGATRITIDEAQQKLREAHPDAKPATMVVLNDPQAAWGFPGARGVAGYYVNPHSGEVRRPDATTVGQFMQTMLTWHRYLGFSGTDSRPRGKWINGTCNLAFCLLAITGLYLWMPRNWSVRSVLAVALFNWRLTGKARDFNWHNSIGLWTAPILIVLTLTAVPISFQWGGRLINSLTGTPPAVSPGAVAQPAIEISAPPPGTPLLSQDALLAIVQREFPAWTTITLRLDVPAAGGGAGLPTRVPSGPSTASSASPATGRETRATRPVTFIVREASSWPRTANTTVLVHPQTAEILQRTGYEELPAAQQVRAWTRFLHTGEALGWGGQLIAGLACLGGCVLVWTGFTLAARRFSGLVRRRD